MEPLPRRKISDILPVITLNSLAPPYPDYPYFEGADLYPFRPHAQGFDVVNAWWLIEASTLAYADKGFIQGRCGEARFNRVEFFSGSSTQCFVASHDDFVLLVFRGTEIRPRTGSKFDLRNILADILADALIPLVDLEDRAHGKVHLGFKQALDEVWGGLRSHLDELKRDFPARNLWVTGHSLGAALATLAAARYGDVQGVYTFGSPKVGDFVFANRFTPRTYRFVNNNDIITRLPPFFYNHVGELYAIDSQGNIGNDRQADYSLADIREFLGLGWDMAANISASIVDHVPTLYATHIFNTMRLSP